MLPTHTTPHSPTHKVVKNSAFFMKSNVFTFFSSIHILQKGIVQLSLLLCYDIVGLSSVLRSLQSQTLLRFQISLLHQRVTCVKKSGQIQPHSKEVRLGLLG